MKWQAKWIWLEQARNNPTTSLLVRKEFSLDKLLAHAQLAISANNIYRVYINGVCIGRGPDRADPRFPYFDSYDVTPHLRTGKNAILALTYHILPAAYASKENAGTRAWCLYNGPGGFIAQLEMFDGIRSSVRAYPSPSASRACVALRRAGYPLPQGERESLDQASEDGRPRSTGDSRISSPLGGEDKGEGYRSSIESAPTCIICTDEMWKILPTPGWEPSTRCNSIFRGPIPRIDLSFSRVVDAAGAAGFDDSEWSAPIVVGPQGVTGILPVAGKAISSMECTGKMPLTPSADFLPLPIAREIPPLVRTVRNPVHSGAIQVQQGRIENSDPRFALRFYEPLSPVVNPSPDGSWLIYDFGRPMGGFLQLELDCNGGAVDLYCGDSLMWFMEEQLRLPQSGECRYETLDWRGCRYLALHFHDLTGPVTVKAVRFAEMVYPFEHRGDFRCSDPTLTRLWRICRDTAHSGTKDHPTDCGREQALWISDLQVHLRAMTTCFGDIQPMVKSVHQMLRVMYDDGVLPVPGPVGIGYGRTEQQLPWSEQPLALALILRDMYWFNNDLALARLAMPKLEKLYAHFARYEDPRCLLNPNAKGLPVLMVFCGWSFMLKENGFPAVFNFEYVLSLAAATELARAIGRNDLADSWKAKSATGLEVLRRTFWDSSRKMYVDGEQDGKLLNAFSTTVNAWAALAGAVDRAEAGSWAEALRSDPAVMQPSCPHDATLLLEALLMLGCDLHARELLDRYFGSMVRNGEPTLPEYWSAGVSGMRYWGDGSRCHPFGSGPAYLSQWYVLGVKPIVPGWSRVRIEPRSLGFDNARGRVPTPHGEIGIEWERDDLSWRLDVDLPAGITAEVALPRIGWGNQRLIVDGEEVQYIHGWDEYRAQAHRERVDGFPHHVRCELDRAGRHTIVTESV